MPIRSSNKKTAAVSPRAAAAHAICVASALAAPRGSDEERRGGPIHTAAEHGVEAGAPARQRLGERVRSVLRRDQSREDDEPTRLHDVVVVAASERGSAELADPKPSTIGAIPHGLLLEQHDAVREALDLLIGRVTRPVVEQEDGARAPDEVLLEGEELTPVAERRLREQTDLGE